MYILTQGRDTIVNLELIKAITIERTVQRITEYVIEIGKGKDITADDIPLGRYKTKQRAEDILNTIIECDSKTYIMPKE